MYQPMHLEETARIIVEGFTCVLRTKHAMAACQKYLLQQLVQKLHERKFV